VSLLSWLNAILYSVFKKLIFILKLLKDKSSVLSMKRMSRATTLPILRRNVMPSCVLFTDRERLIGEDAKKAMTKNPAKAIYQAKRLFTWSPF